MICFCVVLRNNLSYQARSQLSLKDTRHVTHGERLQVPRNAILAFKSSPPMALSLCTHSFSL